MLNIQPNARWNPSLAYLKSKDTESEEGHTGGLQNRPLSEKPGNSFSRAGAVSRITRNAGASQLPLREGSIRVR